MSFWSSRGTQSTPPGPTAPPPLSMHLKPCWMAHAGITLPEQGAGNCVWAAPCSMSVSQEAAGCSSNLTVTKHRVISAGSPLGCHNWFLTLAAPDTRSSVTQAAQSSSIWLLLTLNKALFISSLPPHQIHLTSAFSQLKPCSASLRHTPTFEGNVQPGQGMGH